MAHVELAIGGRTYSVTCREGGQDHLRALALRVDEKVTEARGSVGTTNESRQLLFAALLLADDVAANAAANAATIAAERAAAPSPVLEAAPAAQSEDWAAAAALAEMLDRLAARLERVADVLEGDVLEGDVLEGDGLEGDGLKGGAPDTQTLETEGAAS